MNKIKRILFIFLLSLLVVGCAKKTDNNINSTKKKVTVTTSFIYDMVRQVAGDTVNIDLIIPAGEDPHLYLAKPNDVKKIQEADLVLYHGLHFEGKMEDVLSKKGVAVTKNFPEDKVGKMEEDGAMVIDPHFWFDISLYKEAVKVASEELIKLNPSESNMYSSNLDKYLKELDDLDKENHELLNQIPKDSRKLITPHDAFNYFSRAYDIEVMAPQGVSTESEVSTSNINETVDFIVKNKVKAIFAESTTDPARMKKLQEAVEKKGFKVDIVSGEGKELFSDSLAEAGKDGDTFISMYKHNVKLIVDNLK